MLAARVPWFVGSQRHSGCAGLGSGACGAPGEGAGAEGGAGEWALRQLLPAMWGRGVCAVLVREQFGVWLANFLCAVGLLLEGFRGCWRPVFGGVSQVSLTGFRG